MNNIHPYNLNKKVLDAHPPKGHGRKFLILLAIIAIVGGLWYACVTLHHTPAKVTATLSLAESLMEDHPDSALAELKKIDTLDLRTPSSKAAYSLLMSMALDKNHIFLQDFSTIRPALDYYPLHGSPQERLKTLYYTGRIHQNMGDDDKAFAYFLKAAEDSASCRNNPVLARTYVAMGKMFEKQSQLDDYIEANRKAADIYRNLNQRPQLLRAYQRILSAAIENRDYSLAKTTKNICDSLSKISPQEDRYEASADFYYSLAFEDSAKIASKMPTHLIYGPDGNVDSFHTLLDLAYANAVIRNYPEALDYLLAAKEAGEGQEWSPRDSTEYEAKASYIYEMNNMPQKALEHYKIFVDRVARQLEEVYNSGLIFAEEKYNLSSQLSRRETIHDETYLIVFSIFLILILAIMANVAILYSIKSKKLRIENHKRELEASYNELLTETLRLKIEKVTALEQYEATELKRLKLEVALDDLRMQVERMENEKLDIEERSSDRITVDSKLYEVICERIKMIEGFIKKSITDNSGYDKRLRDLENMIKSDKSSFLSYLNETMEIRYSRTVDKFKKCGLSTKEMTYLYLRILGLTNKEIAGYIEITRINNFSSQLKQKLAMPEEFKTIKVYLKSLLSKEDLNNFD